MLQLVRFVFRLAFALPVAAVMLAFIATSLAQNLATPARNAGTRASTVSG